MALSYEEAVPELYRAPLDQFVSERKRLAGELKLAGDKAGAARLAKLGRPPLSVWAVNQLWWDCREAFEQLLATGARLRAGELAAAAAHREVLVRLRSRAAELLTAAGHSATEATLRRVSSTLAALAASGFAPDVPGALAADRDPPGFEALGLHVETAPDGAGPTQSSLGAEGLVSDERISSERRAPDDERATAGTERRPGAAREQAEVERRAAQASQQRQAEERVERERLERERVERERLERVAAERRRIHADLIVARAELERRVEQRDELRAELERATASVIAARASISELEARLAALNERA